LRRFGAPKGQEKGNVQHDRHWSRGDNRLNAYEKRDLSDCALLGVVDQLLRLFKTEVIQQKGPWRHLEAVELRRLSGSIGEPASGLGETLVPQ
jgi:hypothetical protein